MPHLTPVDPRLLLLLLFIIIIFNIITITIASIIIIMCVVIINIFVIDICDVVSNALRLQNVCCHLSIGEKLK